MKEVYTDNNGFSQGGLDALSKHYVAEDINRDDSERKERSGVGGEKGWVDELPVMDLSSINENRELFSYLGELEIKNGRIAIVILSGGQGSRLGYEHAKGMLDIGITRRVSIFQLLFEKLHTLVTSIGVLIPVFVMTSSKNDKEIKDFFAQNTYFGYSSKFVEFFVQNEFPALDIDDNIYLTNDQKRLFLPNGNGGWFDSLSESEILRKNRYKSIEWFNVVSVDNPLQNMADPIFIGATIAKSCEVGVKVVKKTSPKENVGIVCAVEGKPKVIEYYDIPNGIRYAKNHNGEYKFRYGVTLNYLFKRSAAEFCSKNTLPIHYVVKSVNVDGKCVELKKAEILICDAIACLGSVCAFEVERNKEFAPIKNLTGIDSVDSARKMLGSNGVTL